MFDYLYPRGETVADEDEELGTYLAKKKESGVFKFVVSSTIDMLSNVSSRRSLPVTIM